MIRIGLTGSIGMGKSTTAAMFAEAGIPVWDADAAVHRLYGPDGAGTRAIAGLRPEAVGPNGVDRQALSDWIAADPDALTRIEAVIHPLVAADRRAFLERCDSDLVVLDIPLLFETDAAGLVDHVAVVTTDPESQKARVIERQGMTEARFRQLLDRQMPDAEKRRRADTVIRTDTLDDARADVQRLIAQLREGRNA